MAEANLHRRRDRVAAALLATALAIGGAQAVSAQLAPGRSGSSTMTYLSAEEAMIEVQTFGECYAKTQTPKALKLIATQPSSREEALVYVSLFKKGNQSCLGDVTELHAPLDLVRGGIAEGLLRGHVPLPPEMMQAAPRPAEVRNLGGAARCYTVSHRQEVSSLVFDTRPGSRKEYDAVMKLLPDFLKCVPAGAKAQFNATLVRFRLAEALLRTSRSAPPAGGK